MECTEINTLNYKNKLHFTSNHKINWYSNKKKKINQLKKMYIINTFTLSQYNKLNIHNILIYFIYSLFNIYKVYTIYSFSKRQKSIKMLLYIIIIYV